MAVNLSPIWGAGAQLLDNSGNVLTGGKIYTYLAGTTTPATTYTSSNGNTANSNPIILNSAGRVPYEIWLTDSIEYKFVLKDSNDTLIGTWDNLVGINSNFVNYYGQQEIQTATAGQTVFTLADFEYLPGTGNLSVFVDGVNQYGPGAQYAYVETDSTTVTFVSGLHVGASVKFTTTKLENPGVADASQISYTYPDSTAVTQNVEERLAQYVSVKDFGAVGDGVTDDTTAINNAIAACAGKTIVFPPGDYLVTSTIILPFVDYSSNPLLMNKAITLSGSNYERQIFGASRIFGNINGPVIQAVGVYNGPSGTDFTATIGHGLQDLIIQNTSTSSSTSIGVQMQYIYCPHLKNVEIVANYICLDLGNWTMVGNFDNVSFGPNLSSSRTVYGLKANACWGSVFKHGRSFYTQCATYISASDFRFTDFNAEHNNIVFVGMGSSVTIENCHIEDFDCLYTNEINPIAQITANYANQGSTNCGDFPATISITGGFYLGWTQNAPYFVERPTTLGGINTIAFNNCQVDDVSFPNQITVSGRFDIKDPTSNGRLIFANNYPTTSFHFWQDVAGQRQTQYYSSIVDQIDSSDVTNHYIAKLRVGALTTNMAAGFYPATRTIPSQTTSTWTRTVTGARTTDFVLVQHGAQAAGLVLSAFVSANDTVTVMASNNTSSSLSLGDGSENIMVIQREDGLFSTN